MKIIIRNMDGNIEETEITELLGKEGHTALQYVQRIVHQASGRVLAHAHVWADDRSAGEALIARLHNTDQNGQKLSVKEAK